MGNQKLKEMIKNTPVVKRLGTCWNDNHEEYGFLVEFETETGIHKVRMNKSVATRLELDILQAIEGWENADRERAKKELERL